MKKREKDEPVRRGRKASGRGAAEGKGRKPYGGSLRFSSFLLPSLPRE